MIRINTLDIPELSIYSEMSETQLKTIYEPKLGLFIAESPKVIMRALDAGYEPISMLIDEKEKNEENLELIQRVSLLAPVYEGPEEVLTKITGFSLTRGALCAMKRKEQPNYDEFFMDAKRIVVLEDVVNPTNLGAIIRSGAALGMDGVYITKDSTDPLYRRSIRVSMGTVFQVPWIKEENDLKTHYTDMLHQYGFKTVSFALRNNSIDINDPVLKKEEKLAIILGTEGEGLKPYTIDASDYVVKIPMTHGVDSLNVAAASAVAFWELGGIKR